MVCLWSKRLSLDSLLRIMKGTVMDLKDVQPYIEGKSVWLLAAEVQSAVK